MLYSATKCKKTLTPMQMFTYSFSVDGMDSKQQGGHQAGSPVQEQSADSQEKHTHHGMKNNVEQMVRSCTQLTEEVVQSEGEDSQGSVRFMTPLLGVDTQKKTSYIVSDSMKVELKSVSGPLPYLSHRCSPEVIEEQVTERGCGPQILVVKNG